MAVKSSTTGTRALQTMEQIARHQPVGVSELSRLMATDKSAVQRAIVTLADEGWIRVAPGAPRRWELTGHIHLVARLAQGSSSIRQRALPALAALRDASGETAALTVPDIGRFVVVEVVESRQMLRTAPHVGMVVVTADSASGRAVLPYLPPARQAELLGGAALDLRDAAETRRRGFAVSEDEQAGGSVNIAAPVFEADGWPVAAVLLSAPRERLRAPDHGCAGALVLQTARELSSARPRVEAAAAAEVRPD